MTKVHRFTSEQKETVTTKTNYLLSGDWWSFTVSLPLRHGIAAGLFFSGTIYGALNGLVILEKVDLNNYQFLATSLPLGLAAGAYTFLATSRTCVEIISKPEETKETVTPVIFEDDTPEEIQTGWVRENNRAAKVDFSPMTAALYARLGQYKAGDTMTREQLKDVLVNYTENYSKLRDALKTAGALDENNVWTPAGVQWARGEQNGY